MVILIFIIIHRVCESNEHDNIKCKKNKKKKQNMNRFTQQNTSFSLCPRQSMYVKKINHISHIWC